MANSSPYGTTNTNDMASSSTNNNYHDHESDALLPSHKHSSRSLRHYLTQPIIRTHTDLILLLSYIVTGLLDSSATIIWGAFVSMQTGNSIYLGLGLVDPASSDRWIKSGISIVAFCIGSFLFARFHRLLSGSPRRRWIMLGSFGMQALLIIAAAIILHFSARPEPGDKHDLHWHVLVPLALVALQSAGQTYTSRALEMGSLTSTVLTSIYCDLWGDQKLIAGLTENVARNRRLAAPVMLVLGSMMGGLWAKTEIGIEGALWTASAIKMAMVVAWVFWKEESDED